MHPFVYQAQPQRVVFGVGSVSTVEDEVARLGARRALVLTTPGRASLGEHIADALGRRSAGTYAQATMHVPGLLARAAAVAASRSGADCTVAVGGGSTIGLAKAIALETGLPIVAVPTTYAGSEATSIWGRTEEGAKATGRDVRVLPKTIVYDPGLIRSLPVPNAVASGLNAIAHAAEGLYAHDGNPIVALMATEGLRAMALALPRIVAEADGDARGDALYAAWLCGTVLGSVAMGLHHKLCHVLGGSFGLPHAETHAVMLPHALAYNTRAAPEAMRRIARSLNVDNAALGMRSLAESLGVPLALEAIGMPHEGLERAADLATASPYPNPERLERRLISAMLERAYAGAPPRVV